MCRFPGAEGGGAAGPLIGQSAGRSGGLRCHSKMAVGIGPVFAPSASDNGDRSGTWCRPHRDGEWVYWHRFVSVPISGTTQSSLIGALVLLARWQWEYVQSLSYILGRDIARVVERPVVKDWILLHGGSSLHGGFICSLGYFPFQPVVHNWSIKGCGM